MSKLHVVLGIICLACILWHTLPNLNSRANALGLVAGSFWTFGVTYRLICIIFLSTNATIESCDNSDQFLRLQVRTKRPVSVTPGTYFYVFLPSNSMQYRFLPKAILRYFKYDFHKSYRLMAVWRQESVSRKASKLVFLIDTSKQPYLAKVLNKGKSVLLDGPYGSNIAVESYDTVVLIAEGRGIASVLPLLSSLTARRVYDKASSQETKLFQDQTRRIDLYWWLENSSQDIWVKKELEHLQSLDPENVSH